MSPSHDQEYLCEGLAEELINALTHVDGLRVAARTASFQFRGKGEDIRTVGAQLNVEALLEGSVRKSDDRLRVTVQLIEVASGYHRWSHRFDGQFKDVFAIQDEIAESVAASLCCGAPGPPTKRTPLRAHRAEAGTEAYELYLRGRQHLPRILIGDLKSAADLFRRAIELEPDYGPAYAGLATAHSTLYEWFGANDADLAGAERASERALELGPDLAEAHVARGCALSLMRRYEDASKEFEESIRLNPNLFDPYYYYAQDAIRPRRCRGFGGALQESRGRPAGGFSEPVPARAVAQDARPGRRGLRLEARRDPSRRAHAGAQSARWPGHVARGAVPARGR